MAARRTHFFDVLLSESFSSEDSPVLFVLNDDSVLCKTTMMIDNEKHYKSKYNNISSNIALSRSSTVDTPISYII